VSGWEGEGMPHLIALAVGPGVPGPDAAAGALGEDWGGWHPGVVDRAQSGDEHGSF
jgi:hypothetical protein